MNVLKVIGKGVVKLSPDKMATIATKPSAKTIFKYVLAEMINY